MPEGKWLILTALAMEAKAISKVVKRKDGANLQIVGPKGGGLRSAMLIGCKGVILAGLGGGLDPSLKIGDVVCNSPNPADWPQLPYRWGPIHASDGVIDTPAKKKELFETTGALAVDMESAVVLQKAQAAGVPILIIRAISDQADEEISPEVFEWVDEEGRARPGRAVRGIVRDPALLGQAIRLARQSNQAAKAMAAAVRFVLDRIA
jgi:hypothetical protein